MRHFVLVILLLSSSAIFAQPAAARWDELVAGNDLYRKESITNEELRVQRRLMEEARKRSAAGQNPPVSILSCADSRVPPELMFSKTIGELFVVRTAGNIASMLDIATLEFALARPTPWTQLIVVLAHEDCGAVVAALDPALNEKNLTPGLYELVAQIRQAFALTPGWTRGGVSLRDAAIANARAARNDLLTRSTVIRDAVRAGKLEIYIAYYTLADGKVELIAR
jgi:carbonic anhydrase